MQAAKKEARLSGEFSDDSTTALSANMPGRSQNGCLGGRIWRMLPNWADQESNYDWRKLLSEETQPDKMLLLLLFLKVRVVVTSKQLMQQDAV